MAEETRTRIGELYMARDALDRRRFIYRSNAGTERPVGLEFSVILMDEIARQKQIDREQQKASIGNGNENKDTESKI